VRTFVAFLVLSGNAKFLAGASAVPAVWWPGLTASVLLLAVVLVWARAGPRLSLGDMGLCRAGALRAGSVGGFLALAAALAAVAVLRFPPLLDEPVRYAPLRDLPTGALLLRVFPFMLVDTVVLEELAFRGVLFPWLLRGGGLVRAVLLSSAAFTLWHVVVVFAALEGTNLHADPLHHTLGALGAFAAVFAGGAAFALLRARTGHLAAPLAAHWTFNAVVLLGVWLPG